MVVPASKFDRGSFVRFATICRDDSAQHVRHDGKYVGRFSNYDSVLQNDAFQLAVANTARFLGICLPLLLSGSLILALVLHSRPLRETKAARVFKTTFLLPIAIPVASIVLLWQTLFSRQGLCNGWLTWLGAQPVDFMGTGAAFWVLTATYLWKNCGYTQVLWATGLEAIPADQYEAARVDGAGPWQQFCHITWPALQPTLVLTLILSLLNAFKVFREAYLVAGRYPQQSIYLLQHLFNNWFLSLDLPRLARPPYWWHWYCWLEFWPC